MDKPSNSPVRRKNPIIPGFRPSPRPKQRPINEMTLRELQDRHILNVKLLASPYVSLILDKRPTADHCIFREASTSTYIQRVLAEQAAVESRLIELDGVETINTGLKRTTIKGEDDMNIDTTPEPPTSRTLEAKRKALSRFVEFSTGTFDFKQLILVYYRLTVTTNQVHLVH